MRLHELISPILTKDGKLPPSFVDYMRKHMDTEYGSKHKNKIKQLPKAKNLNSYLGKFFGKRWLGRTGSNRDRLNQNQ